ncbi:MAG: BatA and WFA domain-containing protein [Verrucomicrobiae bacterium]|nr:BatA and WFA domain-containing protein [Verrucomicrobiae bacterium]
MNFLAPTAFAFAAAIPVVILFYLLKRRRTVKLVSSTLLWRKFLAETQASAPFQKLRKNWLLVLQLILLTLAVFALARPFLAGQTASGRLVVAILDASASMQSTDESPSRFERARREALNLVSSLHETDQMVVLLAGGQTEVKQSPTSNKASLRRALQSCEPSDAPTRIVEALRIAHPLVKDRRDAEIHLYSDGAVPDLKEFEFEGLNIVFHQVGKRCNNVGIIGAEARAHPEDPRRRAVFASVFNASSNSVSADLELRFDGTFVETRHLELGPRETVPTVFTVEQEKDGIFSLRLSPTDELTVDNEVNVVSLMPRPVNVLLVSRSSGYLQRALRVVPGVRLDIAPDLTDDASSHDVVVLDDVLPSSWPGVNTLAVRSAPTNWIHVTGRTEAPVIVDWKSTHPILRFVTFDEVQIGEALTIRTPAWGVPLVEASDTPLILAGELGRQRIVWIGFDLMQSTWPLRVSFPIFVANTIEWLNPASTKAAQSMVRPGDPIRMPLPKSVTNAVIRLPNGTAKEIALDPGASELVFAGTERQGVYRVETGEGESVFCVNLLHAGETDTTPKTELRFGRYARAGAATFKPADLELWRRFVAVAFFVLMFEWWFYHRRTA